MDILDEEEQRKRGRQDNQKMKPYLVSHSASGEMFSVRHLNGCLSTLITLFLKYGICYNPFKGDKT